MGGVRPNASENGQISPSAAVRAARGDGSCPNLTSILPEGWKTANIQPGLGVIRRILAKTALTMRIEFMPVRCACPIRVLFPRCLAPSTNFAGVSRRIIPKNSDDEFVTYIYVSQIIEVLICSNAVVIA